MECELMDASNVLKTLVGDVGMFSTGGPGKGMRSRAYNHFFGQYYSLSLSPPLT